ncbi:hypothetical protein GQ54DRAFT_131562, partial [Martensiomyces pterosporus]
YTARGISADTLAAVTSSSPNTTVAEYHFHDALHDHIAPALAALRQMYGSADAAFKSTHQAQAVCSALARTNDLAAVLPTGGGKSLVFHLPAHIEQNHGLITVVVVPLVALIIDLAERTKQLHIECSMWSTDDYQRVARQSGGIIFVSVENVIHPLFADLL